MFGSAVARYRTPHPISPAARITTGSGTLRTNVSTSSAPASSQGAAQFVVEEDRRADAALPVAEVQALVLRMRVARRVLDAHQQQRRAFERRRERADEADRAAGADHLRLASVAARERAPRSVEH